MMNQSPVGGLLEARAETAAPSLQEINATFEKLAKTVEAFQSKNDERIAALEKGRGDVLAEEHVNRINAEVGDLQKEMDAINKKLAASSLSQSDHLQSVTPEELAYKAKYENFIKTGDGQHELEAMLKNGVNAAMTVGSDPDGGLTAPVEWDRTIVSEVRDYSPMRSICNVMTLGNAGFKKLVNLKGTTSGWVGETEARPVTDTSQFAEIVFNTQELYAMPSVSQTLLQDSALNIAEFIAGEVAEEFGVQESEAFVNGDGVNKPKGLMQYETGSSHPLGNVQVVGSGVSGDIESDSLIDLIYAVKNRYRKRAHFIMNNLTLAEIRKLKDGDGNYLWQRGYTKGQPDTLLGYDITEVDEMDDIAANTLPIAFGNFKAAYTIIDRVGVRLLRDPYTAKPYVLFYTTKRVGGGLVKPEPIRYYKIDA